ncbi:hypothetical protein [Umezawaea sp. NPDC059074]|uniref:hypothetical protein n=1 Tax=Umezawaea sp. NPDC059074 TaxID=3346716 RepID=UPI00369325D4
MADESEAVLRLRASRAKLESIRAELEAARVARSEADARIESLQEDARVARRERHAHVLEADAAGIARAKIAREVGMQRSNVYKLIDDQNVDDDSQSI